MGKVLFLHPGAFKKRIRTCKPGVAGVFGSRFPELFIHAVTQGFGDGGIFGRKIVIVLIVGVILAETPVYSLDNKAYRSVLAGKVKGVVSV